MALKSEVKALVAQSSLTLCEPMAWSPPDFSVHGILQARILEWVAIPFSRGSSQLRDQTRVSCIAGGFFNIWATREAFDYWFSFPTYNSAETFFFFITQSWWSGVLVAHSCLTLCDPLHCSPPGSSVHGIFPGRNTDMDYHPFLFFCVIQLDGI